MNPDGSGVARLTNHSAGHATDPAWSPDGTRIAFHFSPSASWGSTDSEIFVINTNGSGLRNLTSSAGLDTDPVWSPNGTHIAFSSSRQGDRDIYIMGADGAAPFRPMNNNVNDFQPDWHR
jgi:TolB protein